MHFSLAAAAAALLSVGSVAAQTTHNVTVGANNGLVFSPTSITAAVGDMIAFQFVSKNHSVTQSTFAAPCTKMTTPKEGIDSGFKNVDAGAQSIPVWTIGVNTTDPLWFFCMQTTHCGKGMVFAVNPTAEKNFTMFQATAMATAANTTTSANGSTPAASGSGAAPSTTKSGAIRIGGSAAAVLSAAAALFVGLL